MRTASSFLSVLAEKAKKVPEPVAKGAKKAA
jgi:hypothetical protein